MTSKRSLVILGMIIVMLWCSQYFFAPYNISGHTKYVDASAKDEKGKGSRAKPFRNLQSAINLCKDGDTLKVAAGEYNAEAVVLAEDLCGNCLEHKTIVTASRGFLIEGKGLTIIGAGADKVKLITNSGYGIMFLNSRNSSISGVTITGGMRDSDGNATDGGIVVKFSSVTVEGCRIADNTNKPDSVVVGIGGIIGREGALVTIRGNEIINNGWDGIALYRGAEAYIYDNIIRKGRGAGIGITWDAYAIVSGNEISDYWKGIGTFGDSRAFVHNNVVRDCLGWGIIAAGNSYLDACNNVVYHNGNCGMAVWGDETSGRFSNNIVVMNGWKEQWVAPRVGIQNYGGWENFEISYNNVWGNEAENYGDAADLTGKKGNISADPLFESASSGNFSLKTESPCLAAGNPAISGTMGGRSDLGLRR